MQLLPFRSALLSALALAACTNPGPVTAEPPRAAPSLGVDLGSSSRVPQLARLVGDGEDLGRTEPSSPSATRGSTGMSHGSTGGLQMDHGSMAGMGHGGMAGMPMDHGAMPGMNHGSATGKPAAQSSMSGKSHSSPGGTQMAQASQAPAQGTGTVNSVDAAGRKINMAHDPIPAIGWPAMTMDFAVAPSVDLRAIRPGARVSFQMIQGQGGMYVIQSMTPAGGGR